MLKTRLLTYVKLNNYKHGNAAILIETVMTSIAGIVSIRMTSLLKTFPWCPANCDNRSEISSFDMTSDTNKSDGDDRNSTLEMQNWWNVLLVNQLNRLKHSGEG